MTQRRGFTLIEILVVVVILGITATLSMDLIGSTDASQRADRAAREAVVAVRYARMLAMTTSATYGIEFDKGNKRFQVFQTTGSNVVNQTLIGGGTYVVNLSRTELAGTTMVPTINGDTTDPYDVTYNALGSTTNYGTVAFSYGGFTRTVTIPAVGDPTIK